MKYTTRTIVDRARFAEHVPFVASERGGVGLQRYVRKPRTGPFRFCCTRCGARASLTVLSRRRPNCSRCGGIMAPAVMGKQD